MWTYRVEIKQYIKQLADGETSTIEERTASRDAIVKALTEWKQGVDLLGSLNGASSPDKRAAMFDHLGDILNEAEFAELSDDEFDMWLDFIYDWGDTWRVCITSPNPESTPKPAKPSLDITPLGNMEAKLEQFIQDWVGKGNFTQEHHDIISEKLTDLFTEIMSYTIVMPADTPLTPADLAHVPSIVATPPAPVRTEDHLVTCDRCNGRRTFTCRMCSGVGALDGINGRGDSQCPECNGDGRVDCLQCKGTGKMEVAAPLPAAVPTLDQIDDGMDRELSVQGLRRAKSHESGWYVYTSYGKVWATDLPAEPQPVTEPVASAAGGLTDEWNALPADDLLKQIAKASGVLPMGVDMFDAHAVLDHALASAAEHTTTDLHFDKQGGVTIVEQKGLQCPECDGTGRVLCLNNRVRNCSKCHGKGVLPVASAAAPRRFGGLIDVKGSAIICVVPDCHRQADRRNDAGPVCKFHGEYVPTSAASAAGGPTKGAKLSEDNRVFLGDLKPGDVVYHSGWDDTIKIIRINKARGGKFAAIAPDGIASLTVTLIKSGEKEKVDCINYYPVLYRTS